MFCVLASPAYKKSCCIKPLPGNTAGLAGLSLGQFGEAAILASNISAGDLASCAMQIGSVKTMLSIPQDKAANAIRLLIIALDLLLSILARWPDSAEKNCSGIRLGHTAIV